MGIGTAAPFLIATILCSIAYSLPGFSEAAVLKEARLEAAKDALVILASAQSIGVDTTDVLLIVFLALLSVLEYSDSWTKDVLHLSHVFGVASYWLMRKITAVCLVRKLLDSFVVEVHVESYASVLISANTIQLFALVITATTSLVLLFSRWSSFSTKGRPSQWLLLIANSLISVLHLLPWMVGNLMLAYGGSTCQPQLYGFRLVTEDNSYSSVPMLLSFFSGTLLSLNVLTDGLTVAPLASANATVVDWRRRLALSALIFLTGVLFVDQLSKITAYSVAIHRADRHSSDRYDLGGDNLHRMTSCLLACFILSLCAHLFALVSSAVLVGALLCSYKQSSSRRSAAADEYEYEPVQKL